MQVRKACPGDNAWEIADIYTQSWKTAYRGIIPQDYLDSLKTEERIQRQGRALEAYLLLDNGRPVGTSSVCPARDDKMAGWGEVVSIYLLPQYFGRGCARQLMDAAINALKFQGFDNIYLWVLEENWRARRFYEKYGFTPSGENAEISIGGKTLTEVRYIYRAAE